MGCASKKFGYESQNKDKHIRTVRKRKKSVGTLYCLLVPLHIKRLANDLQCLKKIGATSEKRMCIMAEVNVEKKPNLVEWDASELAAY
jgi:hypothetical protein